MKENLDRFKDLQIGQTIKNPWDQELTLVTNIVGRVNDELVARVVAMNAESYGSKNVNIISFYVKDGYERLKSQLIRKVMEDSKDQEYHRLITELSVQKVTKVKTRDWRLFIWCLKVSEYK